MPKTFVALTLNESTKLCSLPFILTADVSWFIMFLVQGHKIFVITTSAGYLQLDMCEVAQSAHVIPIRRVTPRGPGAVPTACPARTVRGARVSVNKAAGHQASDLWSDRK